MLRLVYSLQAYSVPDELVLPRAEGLLASYMRNPNCLITESFCNELYMTAIRTLAAEKGIANQLVVVVNDREIRVDKTGRLEHWPRELCLMEDLLMRLL